MYLVPVHGEFEAERDCTRDKGCRNAGLLIPKFGIKEGRLKNEDKVKQIIADQLLVDVDDVTPGSNLIDDLGADSLDVIELVMQFEDAFDIEIADEEAENIKTVKDVLDYIETKV